MIDYLPCQVSGVFHKGTQEKFLGKWSLIFKHTGRHIFVKAIEMYLQKHYLYCM